MAIEFDDIGNGELRAKFHIAMARIRNNIMDPNMDPEAARSITINIKFMPDESGSVRSAFNVKSEYQFGRWYDQENFMISLQANFQPNDDLAAVMRLAGNIEKKNNQTFSDDGVTQVATMTVGVASKADAMVPNPVELIPYRTFHEVVQPASKFVFRIGDKEEPAFKIVEAEGGIWKNEAVDHIKTYFWDALSDTDIKDRIVIIG